MVYVQVVVIQKSRDGDGIYTYCLPQTEAISVSVGSRVVVPFGFGGRYLLGIVVAMAETIPAELEGKVKPLSHVMPESYSLSPEQVALALYLHDEYLSTYAEAFQCVSPSGIEIETKDWYERVDLADDCGLPDGRFDGVRLMNPTKVADKDLQRALRTKRLKKCRSFEPSFAERVIELVSLPDEPLEALITRLGNRSPKQRAILEYLVGKEPTPFKILQSAMNVPRATLLAMVGKGLLTLGAETKLREPQIYRSARDRSDIILTPAQQGIYQVLAKAMDQLDTEMPYLLHGVTGSGKTEIYIELTKKALLSDQQVLILVPEIALTPQLTDKFNRCFEGQIAILHSQIPSKERMEQGLRIRSGELKVIIGARSAIFAPFRKLGLVIMDEEHDDSYKSDTSPRYFAKDIVSWLSKRHGALELWASATPSVESFYRVNQKTCRFLELTNRYNDVGMPSMHLIDMKKAIKNGSQGALSHTLLEAIKAMKGRNEQGILFLNRKGYAPQLLCKACGERLKCPNCDISLTYYKHSGSALCHYCGYTRKEPFHCDACNDTSFEQLGVGVEKVEEDLRQLMPELRVQRVDAGVSNKRGALEAIFAAYEAHEIDVLLGTQIISKGIDFQKISLIGVLGVDALLNMPDYRASERAFNLLTQLAGRGGRSDMEAQVWIQTLTPEHPLLKALCQYDQSGFMADEMVLRYLFRYPPYVELAHLIISAEDPVKAEQGAQLLYHKLKKSYEKYKIKVELSPPNPALYAKIKSRYRMQLILKFSLDERERVKRVLSYYLFEAYGRIFAEDIRVQVDLRPLSLL